MFVKFSRDAKEAQKAISIIVPKQMKEWTDNFGNVCAVVCVSSTIAPGDRIQIVSNSGGYLQLQEGMVMQLVYDLTHSKWIPLWRRALYRLVWMTCGQFVVSSHKTERIT